jgi:hypothetical protein
MKLITNKIYDEERALYGTNNLHLINCSFDGPADGESALKESNNYCRRVLLYLRYPFWHVNELEILDSEMTSLCRAALWYSHQITISNSNMRGIKHFESVRMSNFLGCEIDSPELAGSGMIFIWIIVRLKVNISCSVQKILIFMKLSYLRNMHFNISRIQSLKTVNSIPKMHSGMLKMLQ